MFGLGQHANQYAGDLSGGQRRLVEIMRALMAEPDVVLLDEPMAGLHPRLARELGSSLVALCDHGMTILIVEHELAIMDEFCDPVIVMAEGRVLAEGTMAALRSRPKWWMPTLSADPGSDAEVDERSRGVLSSESPLLPG